MNLTVTEKRTTLVVRFSVSPNGAAPEVAPVKYPGSAKWFLPDHGEATFVGGRLRSIKMIGPQIRADRTPSTAQVLDAWWTGPEALKGPPWLRDLAARLVLKVNVET